MKTMKTYLKIHLKQWKLWSKYEKYERRVWSL
jgi:hypothetical protein